MVSPLLATSRDRATWTTMNVAGLITGKHGVALRINVSGAHNKLLQTEWLKQQQFASHGSRDWRSKVKVSAGPRSPKGNWGGSVLAWLRRGGSLAGGSLAPVFTGGSPSMHLISMSNLSFL